MRRLLAPLGATALAACAARGSLPPPAVPRAVPTAAAALPGCSAAPPSGGWRPGHEPPPARGVKPSPDPPPSAAVASGTLPPLPFARWPVEMASWSSADAHASIYAQRWPREASPEALLEHHLGRLALNRYVDVAVVPGSVRRTEVERGGRRFVAEEMAFTSAGRSWRNLLYATAAPGHGVCAFGVTAANLAPGSEALVQFLRMIDGPP